MQWKRIEWGEESWDLNLPRVVREHSIEVTFAKRPEATEGVVTWMPGRGDFRWWEQQMQTFWGRVVPGLFQQSKNSDGTGVKRTQGRTVRGGVKRDMGAGLRGHWGHCHGYGLYSEWDEANYRILRRGMAWSDIYKGSFQQLLRETRAETEKLPRRPLLQCRERWQWLGPLRSTWRQWGKWLGGLWIDFEGRANRTCDGLDVRSERTKTFELQTLIPQPSKP